MTTQKNDFDKFFTTRFWAKKIHEFLTILSEIIEKMKTELSDYTNEQPPEKQCAGKYRTVYFKNDIEMKEWLTQKTNEYVKRLTTYRGPVTVNYQTFETETKNYGLFRIEQITGGRCIQARQGNKIVNVTIEYNPKEAGIMCRDCLENVVIHEVNHINHPDHSEAFYKDYHAAVHDKNARINGGYFPVTNKCKFCKNKLDEYKEHKKLADVKKYPI
jgi:hypothetical protein